MIFRFIVLKRSHWNDLQFFYFFKKTKKFFLIFRISPDFYSQNMMTWYKYDFGTLIYVGSARFLFSKYDDMAQIRFCAGFLFSKYDDVTQIRFCAAYMRWAETLIYYLLAMG